MMQKSKSKTLECKYCGTEVHGCSPTATGIVCSECVIELYWHPEDAPKKKSVGYPKGWKFMKQFVHKDGTVYFKGIEQPDLKGKYEMTPLAVKQLVVKKSKTQKAAEKQEALVKFAKLKKELVKETRVTYRKKIEIEIKRLQKLI
jgi:hypothetical protein